MTDGINCATCFVARIFLASSFNMKISCVLIFGAFSAFAPFDNEQSDPDNILSLLLLNHHKQHYKLQIIHNIFLNVRCSMAFKHGTFSVTQKSYHKFSKQPSREKKTW